MKFNTLAEEKEHLKQCKDYDMQDEEITHWCWNCESVELECDMTKWMFLRDTKSQWYCKQCFKEIKESENE